MKGLKMLFAVIILLLNNLEYGEGQITLSIKDFITDTNHNVDRSKEFQKAWKKLCKGETNIESALVIQEHETYILQPLIFRGPCASSNIHIQINGKIKAPENPKDWKRKGIRSWISFKNVEGLVLNGSGLLHPHGEAWWPSVPHSHRPTSIRFSACKNITYNGLTQMNSPKNHISIDGCKNVTLSNLTIIAPQDSPNTDGIDICRSHNISILDSSIQTGDDCVAINGGKGGSSDINITRVTCGPGHGISIGSLGRDGRDDKVQNVNVSSCIFNRTQNGARIKSWHGGEGLAENIFFENITLINAKHPIIIDQHYSCLSAKLEGDGVKINNVTFRHFKGTSASKIAIKLDCEKTQECNNIVMEHINITSSSPNKILKAYCKFAQGFEILLSLLLIASYHLQYGEGQMSTDLITIKDFLSDSSNPTIDDQSKAFQDAWKALCQGRGRSLVVHANETYTIQPQLFQGPCISRNPHIQINGRIEAPRRVKDWGVTRRECWLCFEKVSGLVLTGSGLLDVHGETWWSSVPVSSRPRAVFFSGCQNLLYAGLTQRNSPKNHISIIDCNNATLTNLHIIAPANSPNTDGVDISLSHNIRIFSSRFETGDDCIAINGGSFDINIAYVSCGPGHGISVGSLGERGETEMVQHVNVKHSIFKGTQNGARIKTWPGGRGFARNITYENITLINVDFPINIDQRYCNGRHRIPAPTDNAVKVSDVKFIYFRGTCSNGAAINLDCDKKIGCDNILLEHINITSSSPRKPLTAYCFFARIISRFVSIPIKCSFHGDPICPAPYDLPPAPAQPPAPPTVRPSLLSRFLYML